MKGLNIKVIFVVVFMVLTIVTAIVVLLANIGIFGPDVMRGEFAKWGIGVVLGEIVTATVAAFRWEVLSSKTIQILFDIKNPAILGAKLEMCSYEIVDEKRKLLGKGEAEIVRDSTTKSWLCFIPLPSNMRYIHSTKFRIFYDGGKELSTASELILKHTMEV